MLNPTKNLIIKPFEIANMNHVKDWFYSGKYPEFFRDMLALSEEQLKIYALMKDGQGFMIWKQEDYENLPVGFIVLHEMRIVPANIKLAILIDEKFQAQGYCLEAMLEILNYCFYRLRMHKVVVEIMSSNKRLDAMLKKGGFKFECVLKDEAKIGLNHEDVIRYYMYPEHFEDAKKNLEGENV